jgi:hypothetical protein
MAGRSLTTRANSYQRMDRRTYDNSIKLINNLKNMSELRGLRLVNAVENGTVSGAQLEGFK